jgi:plastocyanin
MDLRKLMSPFLSWVAVAAAACLLGSFRAALGVGTTDVTVGDDFFSPQNVTNSVGDSVKWTWQGANSHSSTGPGLPALWDSGIHGNGFVFTQTFSKAGTFPYRCLVHSFQTGTIVVQEVLSSVPPSISILSPTNGATFAAPWTGSISATASANGATITNIDFYAGSILLGSVAHPSATALLNVVNLPAGSYSLSAVAFDNLGATNTSTSVEVHVVTPAPITVQGPFRPSVTSFQFTYSTTPGLTYVIRRATALSAWTPIATNSAISNVSTYLDPNAEAAFNFYSVSLLPNP